MSIIITSACAPFLCDRAEAALGPFDLTPARPGERTDYRPADLTEKMLAANAKGEDPCGQLQVGETWQLSAADLFRANAESSVWGWGHPENLYFVDFWQGFDPHCRFLFAYTSPEHYLAELMAQDGFDPQSISEMVDRWVAYHTEMLRLYHTHSDRALLLNLEAAEEAGGQVEILLADRFDLTRATDHEQTARISGADRAHLVDVFAAALGDRLGEARTLYQALENTADLPLATAPGLASDVLTGAWTEYQGLKEASEALAEKLAAPAPEPTPPDGDELALVKEENELLVLQLHQVQEELEHYFQKYNELKAEASEGAEKKEDYNGESEQGAGATVRAEARSREVVIDLRHFIQGQNWYDPEHDGRWTGPGTVTTLQLPNLAPGRYTLELEMAAAMIPDIANGVNLELNGRPLTLARRTRLDLVGPLAPLKRLHTALLGGPPYPMTLCAVADIAGGAGTLTIKTPSTLSPSAAGDPDTRALGIRVREVKLSPQ